MMRTGGEYIADALIEMGMEYVIGIPGHGCLGIFDAIRDRAEKGKIRYIQARQEMSAVHMADGYYRACGRPLAVLTSIGAGAVNAALGMATAYADSTPVLLLTGDTHTHMRGVGVLQEVERQQDSDFISVMRPIAKRCWRVDQAGQLPRIMARAWNEMMNGRRGPVVVSVPMDVQASPLPEDKARSLPGAPVSPPAASPEEIRKAAAMLEAARRPVIVAGGGVYHRRAGGLLVALAERVGAPVITTMASKSVFSETHPLCGFHGGSKGTEAGNYLCRSADLVLALGCRFADESTSSYRKGVTYNFPETKLIHVDIDPAEIGKNYPADLGVQADAAAFMTALLEALGPAPADFRGTPYFADIEQARTRWRTKVESAAAEARSPVTISAFLREMNKTLPADALVVSSSGNSQAQILQEYVFATPNSFITSGGFSTMGFAYPAALGARLACPGRPVVAVAGDGDFLMTVQELSVAAQYGIAVTAVVVNNCGWLAIKDLQMDVMGASCAFGNDFIDREGRPYSPDFAALARSFGIEGKRISEASEVAGALREALDSGKPYLLEVDVNREYPYSGGAATGWWDVPIPAHMGERRSAYEENAGQEQI